jgi:hypothetical protein
MFHYGIGWRTSYSYSSFFSNIYTSVVAYFNVASCHFRRKYGEKASIILWIKTRCVV